MTTAAETDAPDLAELVRADGIDFVPAAFVDLTGGRCAKPVPAQAVEELRGEGVGFAGHAAGAPGQQQVERQAAWTGTSPRREPRSLGLGASRGRRRRLVVRPPQRASTVRSVRRDPRLTRSRPNYSETTSKHVLNLLSGDADSFQ